MHARFMFGLGLVLSLSSPATAQDKPAAIDPARVDAAINATFAGATPEWRARIALDETQRVCTDKRNMLSLAEAEAIQKREMTKIALPADGRYLGDWKKGYEVANNGRGGQFSDPANTVAGGNCFACHQLDPKELSYGTLGPSLAAYGKDRKYAPDDIKNAYIKIFNSQAVVACSNMPRFGVAKFLSEQQIKDVLAYLFDPQSPVNK